MNNLEEIVAEFYDWKGYLVKKNIHVGKRAQGGYEMELDLVAYQPHENHLIHIETSLDAYAWNKRKERFDKKFSRGTKYILSEVFTWLDSKTEIDQLIILPNKPKNGKLNGIQVKTVDEILKDIITEIRLIGKASKAAISEQYPLLRTIQLTIVGYQKSPLEIETKEI